MPNLEQIEKMLEMGQSFSLTNSQYKEKTGSNLPKGNYYLVHNSAVAKRAEANGFRIVVQEHVIQEKQILFEKVVKNDE